MTDVNAVVCMRREAAPNGGENLLGTFNMISADVLPFKMAAFEVVAWIMPGDVNHDGYRVQFVLIDPEARVLTIAPVHEMIPSPHMLRIAMTVYESFRSILFHTAGRHSIQVLVDGICVKDIYLLVRLNETPFQNH